MGLWDGMVRTVDDLVDADHDGAYLDNVCEGAANIGMWGQAALSGGAAAVAAAPAALGMGTVAPGLAGAGGLTSLVNGTVREPIARAAHGYGDEMSDLLGTRDEAAPHADEHGQNIGGETRRALNPGALGTWGGRLGAVGGGVLGAVGGGIMPSPLTIIGGGLAGAGAGAVAGTVIGTQADRQIEAVSELYSHLTE